ncbi:MAG: alpha amylase catalytic region [Gemmatimonadetes bacterium]|nr:alpha amylase catalytic region [Gemmatimonadota bacterium]
MKPRFLPAAALLALAACQPLPRGGMAGGNAQAPPPPAAAAVVPSADPAFYPAWSRSATIYEVNVRQYTPEGTFAALQAHLPRLKAMGVDILWLMPVQPIGVKNRKGGLGSPYSISDYTAVNREYGTEADFRRFVDAAHAQGMRVILDWVANHTAFDHEWTVAHGDWYVHRADGTISNARDNEGRETDWTDVAELDYGKPAMRRAMIEDMRWWVTRMGVDGFRCDVAGGVPTDFWLQARAALRSSRRDLFLLAEAEDPGIHAAFHATYGWELHHLLNEISKGSKTTAELDPYFARQERVFGRGPYRMYFTSDHDENSWNGTEFERMGVNHQAAFVLAATMGGSFPEIYTGQEASLNKRLRFFEKDTVDWNGPSLESFYHAMFDLRHGERAIWSGTAGAPQRGLATNGGPRVYAFTRMIGSDGVLVAVNFGDTPATVAYHGLTTTGAFGDWFSNAQMTLAESGKLDIPAHGYRVLVHGSPVHRSGR